MHLTMAFYLLLLPVTFPFTFGASLPAANTLAHRDLPKGHTVEPLHVNGTIAGIPFEGYGTVQEIHAQFQRDHPDVVYDPMASALDARSSLESRSTTGLFCIPVSGWGWVMADIGRISGGVNYLHGIQANCNIGAGPGTCSRMSCSYDAAIYYCNDNPFPISVWCPSLGDIAQDLCNQCNCPGGQFCQSPTVCGGQEFQSGDFNIIVRQDSC